MLSSRQHEDATATVSRITTAAQLHGQRHHAAGPPLGLQTAADAGTRLDTESQVPDEHRAAKLQSYAGPRADLKRLTVARTASRGVATPAWSRRHARRASERRWSGGRARAAVRLRLVRLDERRAPPIRLPKTRAEPSQLGHANRSLARSRGSESLIRLLDVGVMRLLEGSECEFSDGLYCGREG